MRGFSDFWKNALAVVGAAGGVVVAVFGAQSYLDHRYNQLFFEKSAGLILVERLNQQERQLQKVEVKIDAIQDGQNDILVELGKISQKMDKK